MTGLRTVGTAFNQILAPGENYTHVFLETVYDIGERISVFSLASLSVPTFTGSVTILEPT